MTADEVVKLADSRGIAVTYDSNVRGAYIFSVTSPKGQTIFKSIDSLNEVFESDAQVMFNSLKSVVDTFNVTKECQYLMTRTGKPIETNPDKIAELEKDMLYCKAFFAQLAFDVCTLLESNPFTLEEGIKFCDSGREYNYSKNHVKSAIRYAQLAEWLRELKQLREGSSTNNEVSSHD